MSITGKEIVTLSKKLEEINKQRGILIREKHELLQSINRIKCNIECKKVNLALILQNNEESMRLLHESNNPDKEQTLNTFRTWKTDWEKELEEIQQTEQPQLLSLQKILTQIEHQIIELDDKLTLLSDSKKVIKIIQKDNTYEQEIFAINEEIETLKLKEAQTIALREKARRALTGLKEITPETLTTLISRYNILMHSYDHRRDELQSSLRELTLSMPADQGQIISLRAQEAHECKAFEEAKAISEREMTEYGALLEEYEEKSKTHNVIILESEVELCITTGSIKFLEAIRENLKNHVKQVSAGDNGESGAANLGAQAESSLGLNLDTRLATAQSLLVADTQSKALQESAVSSVPILTSPLALQQRSSNALLVADVNKKEKTVQSPR